MAKREERRRAVELRKKGKSYREIRKHVKVSKSSLSLWLRSIPLTDEQILGLKRNKDVAVERYRRTMRIKRENRYKEYYKNQKERWLPLSRKEEFLAGLFLYWGEGNKANRSSLSINNTDPAVVKFSVYWINKCLEVAKSKIRVQVHLYDDMDIESELNFWSEELGIHRSHFVKPYIKTSLKSSIDQKGFGHGTCAVMVHNTVLKENILMAIKAISDVYGRKVGSSLI